MNEYSIGIYYMITDILELRVDRITADLEIYIQISLDRVMVL